jgi:DNA-binding transcriptional LysR family regulator
MSRIGEVETFITVVESGSFSAAARSLGVSKSHVSKTLSRLEERLGARLLNRTTRHLGMTDIGQDFYDRGLAVLAELEAAERAVTALQTEPRGTLRISGPLTFGVKYLTPVISKFMLKWPELRVDLHLDDRRVDLMAEGFDLAVRIVSQLDDSSFIAKRLARVRSRIWASEDYLARRGTPRVPDDLKDHDCLLYAYQRNGPTWTLVGPDGETRTVRVDGRIEVNNGEALQAAACDGLGLVIGPDFISHETVRTGRLRSVLPDWTLPDSSIWAVYPHNRHLSAKVRLLIEALAEAFGPEPWNLDTLCAGKNCGDPLTREGHAAGTAVARPA